MYRLATKRSEKTNHRNYFTVSLRLSESKSQEAHCAATRTVCERKVRPVSTNDVHVNKQ